MLKPQLKKPKILGENETNDLRLMSEVMEDFVTQFKGMSQAARIDLAARLKPIAKSCKVIDDAVKGEIKADLKHEDGTLYGNLFKAILKIVPTHRLNQSRLKEERPNIHAEYDESVDDERVTYELR